MHLIVKGKSTVFIYLSTDINNYRQHSLRELIIDSIPPQFKTNVEIGEDSVFGKLNSDQQGAIKKVCLYVACVGQPCYKSTKNFLHPDRSLLCVEQTDEVLHVCNVGHVCSRLHIDFGHARYWKDHHHCLPG